MPRKPIGDHPLTDAERQQRRRQRLREQGVSPSRNAVTKQGANNALNGRVDALEHRVEQLEKIIERISAAEIEKNNPPVVVEIAPEATDEEIADAYWGGHPGHVAGYKVAGQKFGVDRKRINTACEGESKRRREVYDLRKNNSQSASEISSALGVSEPYVKKAIAWVEAQMTLPPCSASQSA